MNRNRQTLLLVWTLGKVQFGANMYLMWFILAKPCSGRSLGGTHSQASAATAKIRDDSNLHLKMKGPGSLPHSLMVLSNGTWLLKSLIDWSSDVPFGSNRSEREKLPGAAGLVQRWEEKRVWFFFVCFFRALLGPF